MKKIAILKADSVDAALQPRFGDVDLMMREMLEKALPDSFCFKTFSVAQEEFPEAVRHFEGYLITGSRAGIYESEKWITELLAFIREVFDSHRKLVGICFGHQAIAQALGGRVERYEEGWGVGLHSYWDPTQSKKCDKSKSENLDLLACHQDQVLQLPPQATHTLSSDFCRYAGYQIDNRVFTVQPHPEFSPHYLECVLRGLESKVDDDRLQRGLTSLSALNHSEVIAERIATFLSN